MHEAQGVFCKTDVLWIIDKSFRGKKTRFGPNLDKPNRGKRLVLLTSGQAQADGEAKQAGAGLLAEHATEAGEVGQALRAGIVSPGSRVASNSNTTSK